MRFLSPVNSSLPSKHQTHDFVSGLATGTKELAQSAAMSQSPEEQVFNKLTDYHLRLMLTAVTPKDIVNKVMRGASNTDDKGLMLMHYAVDLLLAHCRVSSEDNAILVIEKTDRGSNKTFSRCAASCALLCCGGSPERARSRLRAFTQKERGARVSRRSARARMHARCVPMWCADHCCLIGFPRFRHRSSETCTHSTRTEIKSIRTECTG